MKNKERKNDFSFPERGQALITLLFFMIVVITITSAAVTVAFVNALSTSVFEQSHIARSVSEAGLETALVKLLRNPDYTGETITIDQATVTVQVSGSSPKVITSEGRLGNYLRKTQVEASFINNVFTILTWKEVL